MIKFFTKLEDFKKETLELNPDVNVETLVDLDFAFFEKHEKYILISISDYDITNPNNLILAAKDYCYVYSNKNFNNYEKRFKNIIKKPYGESTVIILLLLKNILKNYSQEFEKIRNHMNALDFDPVLERVEESGRALRRHTDRIEELVNLIITLKEEEVKEFDT